MKTAKPNIVILDAWRTNPGDIGWRGLEELGNLTTYDWTDPDDVVERAAEADIVLTNKSVVRCHHLERLPRLKYIGVLATGVNVVDVEAAKERGIAVTNIPAYSTDSVAQTVYALLLAIAMHPEHFTAECRAGRWSASQEEVYDRYPLIELAGLRLGIIGMGNIGSAVARIGRAFGMQVAAASSKPQSALPEGVEKLTFDELLASSDVVTLHCPLTADNARMINADAIARMKPGAILINTARGGLIDDAAVADALRSGHLYAAGIEVADPEPPLPSNPLLSAPNVIMTPHIAWATKAARIRLVDEAVANLAAWLDNIPRNLL